ncbi:MAG: DUF5681 domain-containing protein [Candidatus Acidiferrales bacterium]
MNDDEAYEVGFGKPPRRTQFAKGKSGNPRGRPKGALNVATMLKRILEEEVIITQNGRRRTATKLEAAFIQLTDKATGGDLKALQLLASLWRSAEERGSQGVILNSVHDDLDKKVVSGILSRISAFNKEDSENANEPIQE